MRRSGLAVLATVIALAACDDNTDPPPLQPSPAPVASVTITPGDIPLVVEDHTVIDVVLKDADGNVLSDRAVTWASVSPAVATVDTYGNVYGHTLGIAAITATSEGKADTITVSVVPMVVVSPRLPSLFTGDTTQLAVTLLTKTGASAGTAPVTWSATTGGTTVDAAGVVHAGAPGVVRVTATAAGGTGTVDVAVIRKPGTVTRKVAWMYTDDGAGTLRQEIWVADADGGNAMRVSPLGVLILSYGWSPNGDRLAISTLASPEGPYQFYVVTVDGTVQAVTENIGGYDLTWSPDGEKIAVASGSYLVVVPSSGGLTQLVGTGLTGYVRGPRWSPDGRSIAFTSDACDKLTVMDIDGTHRRDLDLPQRPCFGQWSPDGKLLAYDWGSTYLNTGAFTVPVIGSAPTAVSPNCTADSECGAPDFHVVEWLSDGYSLAMGSSGYSAYDRRTGEITLLGPSGRESVMGWSPDRSKAIGVGALDGDSHSRIAVLNGSLTSALYISAPGRDALNPTWQPSP